MVYKKAHWLILVLIVILAAGLRLFDLTGNPPALNWDEVSHAYNAYSLLHTGADQWGMAFPFPNFRAYGDYPTVLNLYLTIPSIALFGPTDFAVRFPHALIGILAVLMIYIAAYFWSKHRCLALFAAFLFAVSPWTFFPSRAVFQSNWTVFLLTLGLALYFSRHRFLSVFIFALSLFAYHNTRIFVPLLLPVMIFPHRQNKRVLVAGVLTFLLAGYLLLSPEVRARGSWVGIIDSGAVAFLEQSRNHSGLPPFMARLVYNRPSYFVYTAAKNYLGYFSPDFLFFKGGTQYQYSVPGFGLLNPILLPFFYLGFYLLFKRRNYFLAYWLLVSPVPAAITRDSFAVIRATTMIPVVVLTTVLGLMFVSVRLKSVWHWLFWTGFLVVFCAWAYFFVYFDQYPKSFSRDWQYGYRQMVGFVKSNFNSYDRIIITKYYAEPHEYVLWYWPWSPKEYRSDLKLSWNYHAEWYWVDRFSKFEFVNDWDLPNYLSGISPEEKVLVVSSPSTPVIGKTVAKINFLNGDPAFIIKDY